MAVAIPFASCGRLNLVNRTLRDDVGYEQPEEDKTTFKLPAIAPH